MAKRHSKRVELAGYLERIRPPVVGEREWAELRETLAPISDSYLRKLLRAEGVPLAPLVEGVRQDSFEELERTLAKMLEQYDLARVAGDRARQAACRAAVITAKDHARWAMRSEPGRTQKQEMVRWMLTWLENPPLFPQWLALRKRSTEFRSLLP